MISGKSGPDVVIEFRSEYMVNGDKEQFLNRRNRNRKYKMHE